MRFSSDASKRAVQTRPALWHLDSDTNIESWWDIFVEIASETREFRNAVESAAAPTARKGESDYGNQRERR